MMIFRGLTIAVALIGMIMLSGCGARHMRDAQDSFNAGTAAENQLSTKGDEAYTSALGASTYGTAVANYKVALSLLDKELTQNRAELDKDKLTGTAWTLKCLALWRIADLDASIPPNNAASDSAIKCAKDGLADTGLTLGTRDRVLLKALPAFVEADRGRGQTSYSAAKDYFVSAQVGLDDAIAIVPGDHGVLLYLRLVYFRMLRSWRSAIKTLGGPPTDLVQNEAAFDAQYCALKPRIDTDKTVKALVLKEFQSAVLNAPKSCP